MLERMDFRPDQETVPGADRPHDVWLVYDGQCPYSRLTSRILRIQTNLGRLVLLEARHNHNHPVVRDLNRMGLDLNRGMVVRFRNQFYHAREALLMLAELEARNDAFNWLHAHLLRNRTLAGLTAAGANTVRSSWLWLSGKPGINIHSRT